MTYQYIPCLFLKFFSLFGYCQSKLLGISDLCLTLVCNPSRLQPAYFVGFIKKCGLVTRNFTLGEKNALLFNHVYIDFVGMLFLFQLIP